LALYRDYAQDYMRAYEDAIRATATPDAPWYVIPANNKWFTRVIVAAAIIHTLAALDLHYPKVDKGKRRDLAAARPRARRVSRGVSTARAAPRLARYQTARDA